MKLMLPEGFTPPSNARPGETFEVVATIEPEEDGSFMLVAVDGIKLPEEDEIDERVDASKVEIPFGEEESDEYA